jgi:hypothetical protein
MICSGIETLEERELLTTFVVSSLNAAGPGSLRQAIVASNAQPGPNTIDFSVSGTIKTGKNSLPPIVRTVAIDGSSAPTFEGTPVVTVNFQGSQGLRFNPGSDGSSVTSLSLVKAGGAGIRISSSFVTIQGNDIGVLADGQTRAGNKGDGIRINASSHGDLIGRINPVTSIDYYNTSQISIQPVTLWQGIRAGDVAGQYLITGTSNTTGLLFSGTIGGIGKAYPVEYPGSSTTSVYGPNDLGLGQIQLVGSYQTASMSPALVNGFLFQGTTADLPSGGTFTTIDYPGAAYNFVHSTMGGLAVGNSSAAASNGEPEGAVSAYIYNIATSSFVTNIVYPGSVSNTAYGIWQNSATSYTICGGTSNVAANNSLDQNVPIGQAFLVDYNSATKTFSNWTTFNYPNGVVGQTYESHFEGISSVENGTYTLVADSVETGSGDPAKGSFVTVTRNGDGTFGSASWVDLSAAGSTGITTANSVYGNQVVGIGSGTVPQPFQATVNSGFQLSNVISGNGGNGINIAGSNNVVAMNSIGTDSSGTVAIGNGGNGILVTQRASGNLIGGSATNGNDPTAGEFVRPPQGNLISGNRANGVLINGGATRNTLSGNFVGTAASGNSALGNSLDGVAIVGANNNQLIGCNFQQSPFVYYNVLSGNRGNGLRITNSNNTTVQANFMGVGANNGSIVANRGDGLLVSGSSKQTQVGGVIPLGNVISGNNRNGIEVTGSASGFTSFNTFAGIYAFLGAAPNRLDGILITSTGRNNQIRTCIVSGNLKNGIELAGNATGVQITDTAIGTDTNIESAIPNGGDGIRIGGTAHGNSVGGFQPSVEQQVTVSSNYGYGIDVLGKAYNNSIFHTNIGTGGFGITPLGNTRGGIFLGSGTSRTTIGGTSTPLQDFIENNQGAGITIQGSARNVMINDTIENNTAGGITLNSGRFEQIGVASYGNTITSNGQNGLMLVGDVTGTLVQANTIGTSASNGVKLVNARKALIGGTGTGQGNDIVNNGGYGIYYQGNSGSTVVVGNQISGNGQGDTN